MSSIKLSAYFINQYWEQSLAVKPVWFCMFIVKKRKINVHHPEIKIASLRAKLFKCYGGSECKAVSCTANRYDPFFYS